jgi:hypothetical protein
MSLSWVLGNFASHGICGVGMMKVGWVFIMLVLLVDWVSVVCLMQVGWGWVMLLV